MYIVAVFIICLTVIAVTYLLATKGIHIHRHNHTYQYPVEYPDEEPEYEEPSTIFSAITESIKEVIDND